MKTEKTLDEKLRIAHEIYRVYGLNQKEHPRGNRTFPEDVEFLKNDKYDFAAVKWERNDATGGGGVEWTGWITLYYREKEKDGIAPFRELETEKIVTRDKNLQRNDKPHLWDFKYVGLKELEQDKVEVAWTNEKGIKGPTYQIKLEQITRV